MAAPRWATAVVLDRTALALQAGVLQAGDWLVMTSKGGGGVKRWPLPKLFLRAGIQPVKDLRPPFVAVDDTGCGSRYPREREAEAKKRFEVARLTCALALRSRERAIEWSWKGEVNEWKRMRKSLNVAASAKGLSGAWEADVLEPWKRKSPGRSCCPAVEEG